MSAETANSLIREAYAFKGPRLQFFARGLGVSPEVLARTIIHHVPPRPDRARLRRLLALVVPHLPARERQP